MTQARSLPGELPFGGGKTILVEHGDTWSGYMHLSDIEPQIYKNSMVKDSESLGISGNTGHSGGAHLHFFIFQPEKNIMYNPLLILDEKDRNLIQGKKVLVVDDVISTGSTLQGMRMILEKANATVAGEAAILTEGDRAQWMHIHSLGHLPLFTD